jgi:phosphate starvation-inducible protein PhoH and related proteins
LTGTRQPTPPAAGKAAKPYAPQPMGHATANGRIVIPFEDNRLVGDLLGPHDAHLALIEQKLGVNARADGNIVTISGPSDSCAQAKDVLEHLYARLRSGAVVSRGDIDGAIRHARMAPDPASSPGAIGADGMAQIRTRKRLISARTPRQSDYIRALDQSDLVFGVGPAGTGKTYLAVVYGAAMLERGQIERIILSRPAVEAGERLGFLPGDMKDKVDPYLRPLYDALYDVLPPERVIKGLETDQIEIAPLAFMRGRTLAHSFVILDEAQNCTPTQMKMFLTRLGEGSKMVITGDPTQVDLPKGQKSGLEDALGVLKGVPGIETIGFTRADVVRRDLVAKIVEAYENAG